jgi:hypothetical protein
MLAWSNFLRRAKAQLRVILVAQMIKKLKWISSGRLVVPTIYTRLFLNCSQIVPGNELQNSVANFDERKLLPIPLCFVRSCQTIRYRKNLPNSRCPNSVIVGITGNQGASVANAFLSDSNRRIRATTRDPSKPSAQEWASKGIELVQGDMDDVVSLEISFVGATAIFAMTDCKQFSCVNFI